MSRKSIYLVAFVLVLCSVSNAANIRWTDLGADHLWSTPANWDLNRVPTLADDVFIDVPAAAEPNGPIIQDGIDAKAHGIATEVAGVPTLTMTGGTLEVADWIWWGDGRDSYAIWNMSGGTIDVVDEFELGWDGGAGTLIMTGGTVNAGELIIPTGSGAFGELFLHGGTYNVGSGGLSMTANGLIDITIGTLVLEGDATTTVNGLITAGRITAYNGAGYFELDFDDRNPGKTTLTAVPITEKAYKPDPPNGAENVTTPLLRWRAGLTAASHDVYCGTNPTPGTAEFRGRQPLAMTMYWHGPGLVPGATYYWRIDEVEADGTTIHTGDVWSFTSAPPTAYDPNPCDGMKRVDAEADLSWTPGLTGISHDVYFGTDGAEVANGTGGTFKGNQPLAAYDPGTLAENTTYYWRIDEVEADGTTKHTGDVWQFTIIGPIPADAGLKAEYFHWSGDAPPARSEAFRTLVLTRIDPEVDFLWGNGSPAGVSVNLFSARWTGELDVPVSGLYSFSTNTDDGIRLWVDEELIIDNWTDHGATVDRSKSVELAGERYSIRMEWYENDGDAVAQLYWESPCIPRQIIPQAALSPPLRAFSPKPANGATGVTQTPTLKWTGGDKAVKHNVYFSTDQSAVADADTTTPVIYRGRPDTTSYIPMEAPLEWGQTYYWRIDEVNNLEPESPWKGSVWSFTVADYIIVDDFEDYNDYCDRIFYTWGDGWGHSGDPACGVPPYDGNGSGSTIGYLDAPYAEQTIVHEGAQSMPFDYNNINLPYYSETERTFDPPQDWTRKGVKALTLWFYGNPGNAAEQLYVAVEDSTGKTKVVNHEDPNAVQLDTWQEWNIDLKRVSDAGVNLASIKKTYVGVGDRNLPKLGSGGMLYVDDIRLYKPRCVPSLLKPDADLSGNCVVDYPDLEIMANEWLVDADDLQADVNQDNNVDLKDYAGLADMWLDVLLWP